MAKKKIEKKLKKLEKSAEEAQDNLLRLVKKKAKKKVILDTVDQIQDLEKSKKQLKKKVKSEKQNKSDKKVKSEKKANPEKKEKSENKAKPEKKVQSEKDDVQPQETTKVKTSVDKAKKKVPEVTKEDSTLPLPPPEVLSPAKAPVSRSKPAPSGTPSLVTSSTQMRAFEAVAYVASLQTKEAIRSFIQGEKRKTVLEKANRRMFHLS